MLYVFLHLPWFIGPNIINNRVEVSRYLLLIKINKVIMILSIIIIIIIIHIDSSSLTKSKYNA